MYAQHRLKAAIKPRLIADKDEVRKVRFGPARGARCLLNRRTNLQRELGLYETELNRVYRRWITPKSVVYDIGAADGFSSLGFAKLASDGAVVAFEPDAGQVARFETNVALNRELAHRITLQPVAVEPEAVDFRELNAPSFVKIDVDGAELQVLAALGKTLEEHKPTVLIETHSAELERACRKRVEEIGYRTRVIDKARWRFLYPEWRPAEHNRWLLAVP